MHTMMNDPLDLPCGVQLKNRLFKAAMSDSLGDGAGNPTQAQMRLYERWAEGGAALSLIGEVQVSPHYPEKPGNLVLGPLSDLAGLQHLAQRGSRNGAQIWPQLGHAGALAHAPISTPKGPSALNVEGLRCGGMALSEIQALPTAYTQAALCAKSAGFGGVQIHAGHGFLLSQFLSPLFNHRCDAYGGTVAARFRIIRDVIAAVRDAVGPSYPIGIKINATDRLDGGLTTVDALEVVKMLDQTSVDLIDVSGGTYFPGAVSSSDGTRASGPYFTDFAHLAKRATTVPVMVTGGFMECEQAAAALQNADADAVGIARALALSPELPNAWLNGDACMLARPTFDTPPPGGMTAWYSMRLTALGQDAEEQFDLTPAQALQAYEARDAARVATWRHQFD